MTKTFNQNSTYIQSLVDFTLDTKPYHSKLTEIAVEYQFADDINVTIRDGMSSRAQMKAAWLYDYFSGGNSANRTLGFQRVVRPDVLRTEQNLDPLNNPGAFKVGRDELTDLLGVPYVYNKKNTVGIADAWLQVGSQNRYLTRGHDFHHSYGSLELRISAASANDPVGGRRWAETRQEDVLSNVYTTTRSLALDVSNPSSANRQIYALLQQISAHLVAHPTPNASAEIANLTAILNTPDLPQSYEVLLQSLAAVPVLSGYANWAEVGHKFSSLTPPMFFGLFGDLGLREGGQVIMDDVVLPGISITNLQIPAGQVADEWTFEVVDTTPLMLTVTGSSHGYIGACLVGQAFNSTYLTFNSATTSGTPTVGDKYTQEPESRLIIADDAPLEVWNIIKTDPIAYSRPTFSSTRYGYLQSTTGTFGAVDVLDLTIPTGTVILTCVDSTTFVLSSTAEPSYTASVTVGTYFNDGRLAFTIMQGSVQPFVAGDEFLINIVNKPAEPVNFDLYYGYDLDGYDNNVAVYNNTDPLNPLYNVPLSFGFDSRFVDYDVSAMGLTLSQAAQDGRQFRLMAIPDGTQPVATMQKDGSGVYYTLDLTGATSGIAPDPALNSVPVYSMAGDPVTAPDLLLYYTTAFRLEYSDDNFNTTHYVADVPVGSTFTDAALGVSFSIPVGTKPFIAVSSDDGAVDPRVEGGDVFVFTVVNEDPIVDPLPVIFSGANVPRMVMHDGFYSCRAADYLVQFTSSTDYTITGYYTSGSDAGGLVAGYPLTGNITAPGTGTYRGLAFQDDSIHFSIVPGAGFGAGDAFKFSTYDAKPSILVHGSVSGWQENAEIGKWYWNGKIGFKIGLPVASIFVNNLETTTLPVTVSSIRPDCGETHYVFTQVGTRYVVTTPDRGHIGSVAPNNTFTDGIISVVVGNPNVASFTIKIEADPFQFWNAPSVELLRSSIAALSPSTGNFVNFKKAELGKMAIALDYSAVTSAPNATALQLQAVDLDFVDLDTGGVALTAYSPEAGILNGWLPVVAEGYDATSSVASFPDAVTDLRLMSAATGEAVGKAYSTGWLNEPIVFEWDETFFNTYLPLNTRASLVDYGTCLDEKVQVSIFERINFLSSGGVLLEDALFKDAATATVTDDIAWTIKQDLNTNLDVVIDDTFAGYLAGYGNLPFDAEDATGLDLVSLAAAQGMYDTGLPLVDNFLRAVYLNSLPSPTTAEATELSHLLLLIDNFLTGSIGTTSFEAFMAALAANGQLPTVMPDGGLPSQGLAMDVNETSTSSAAATITQFSTFSINEKGNTYDTSGFDTLGLDMLDEQRVIMAVRTDTPVPASIPPGTTYATLDTPFYTTVPARVFEIEFIPENIAGQPVVETALPITPTFRIWTPAAPTGVNIQTVTQLSPRRFQFSLGAATEAKVTAA